MDQLRQGRSTRASRPRAAAAVALGLACALLAGCGSRLSGPELSAGAAAIVTEPNGSAESAPNGASASSDVAAGAEPDATGSPGRSTGRRAAVGTPSGARPPAALPGRTKGELVFGSFGTSSGPIGALLAPAPTALRAWVADVNARGGINGHSVRVIFEDDGADPGRALAIAQRMVEKDHVIAFLGTYAAQTIQAVIPYLEKKKIPLIVPEGANVAEDHSPMVFMPQTSADVGNARATLMALVSLSSARKIALLACREVSTCPRFVEVVKEYSARVGVRVVYEAQSSIAQPDYTAEMVQAREAGAEAVFLYFDNASTLRAVRSAHRQGWQPLFVGGSAVNDDSFIESGRGEIDSFLSLSVTAPYSASPLLRPYVQAVARYKPGGRLGGTGATAWTAGKLAERLGAYLPDQPKPSDVLSALYRLRDETLGGLVPPFTFVPGKHYTNHCSVPLTFSKGRFVAPLGDRFVCAT